MEVEQETPEAGSGAEVNAGDSDTGKAQSQMATDPPSSDGVNASSNAQEDKTIVSSEKGGTSPAKAGDNGAEPNDEMQHEGAEPKSVEQSGDHSIPSHPNHEDAAIEEQPTANPAPETTIEENAQEGNTAGSAPSRQAPYNISDGFKVFCMGSGKNRRTSNKTNAIMRYDLDKCNWEFVVKDDGEEKRMSLKDFCQLSGNNAKGKIRCRDQIFDSATGELLLWQKLDLQSKEMRKKAGKKPQWSNSSSNPNTYKSYKRKREQSDSDEDEDTSWARGQKQCEAQERFERNETFQARRKAEQEALNNSFFRIHGRKKEENESMYGLDLTSNVLLEGFGCRADAVAAERAKRLHELVESGKIREEGQAEAMPLIRHEELNTDSELLLKVSREFVKTSRINVKDVRPLEPRAHYDPAPSKQFWKQYQAGRLEAPAEAEAAVAVTPKKSVGRWSKSASSSQLAQQPQPGSLNIAQTRVINGSKMECGAWEWENEEIKLFDALFACYDDDCGTLSRLLRTKSEKQVKEMISRSRDDVRCEVCRNPEDEDKMMLCDRCDRGYHTFCLSPPLAAIPDGDWYCAACTSQTSLRPDPANALTAVRLSPHDDSWWDTKSLSLQELEQRAVDELVASVSEIAFAQLRRAAQTEEGTLSKLALHDVHWARVKSIFSVCLLTCPVPIRNEVPSAMVNPLRRHLRVVVAAVRKAFALEEILAVSDAREQGLDTIEHDAADSAPDDRGAAWIFQVNTQLVDLDRMLRSHNKDMRCLVGRHAARIAVGDRVYLWRCGEVSYELGRVKPITGGVVAVGHVQSKIDIHPVPAAMAGYCRPLCQQLQAFEKRPSCLVSIQHVMAAPAHVTALRQSKSCAGLPILTSAAGSVFRLTEKQMKGLDDALVATDSAYSPQLAPPVRQSAAASKRASAAAEKELKEVKYATRGHFVHPDASDTSDKEGEEEEKDSESDNENSERRPNWMRQCAVLLAKLRRHRDAKPFQKPVDIAGLGLHDYLDVLKREGCQPIDFETIDSKLNSSVYKRDRDFCKDVRRVFYNASVYNPEDDPVYRMANNISGEFEPSWAKYKQNKQKRKSAAGTRRREKEAAKNGGKEEDGEEAGGEERSETAEAAADEAQPTSTDAGQPQQEGEKSDAVVEEQTETENAAAQSTAERADEMEVEGGGEGEGQESKQDPEAEHKETALKPPAGEDTSAQGDAKEADSNDPSTAGDATATEGKEGEPPKRCKVCDGFSGAMIVCDATGAAFHLSCLEDPLSHPPDGPWVSPLAVLQATRKTQHAGDDGALLATCPACRQPGAGSAMLGCGGCKQKLHAECVRGARVLAEEKLCLCTECEKLLPPAQERQTLLQILLRREVLIECRRLLHLHCELCSRDRQRDLDTELHRFRVLKQTGRLGDRIFQYNRVLLAEANELLGQVFKAIP